MSRPLYTWMIFGLCGGLLIAAMAWVSLTVVRLDQAEARARHQAELEENVRLALWRMESAIAPLIAQESSLPPSAYQVSHPPFEQLPPNVLLRFQVDAAGNLTSPQLSLESKGGLKPVGSAEADRLAGAKSALNFSSLAALLAKSPAAEVPARAPAPPPGDQSQAVPAAADQSGGVVQEQSLQAVRQQSLDPQREIAAAQARQADKSSAEFRMRAQSVSNIVQQLPPGLAASGAATSGGLLTPLWMDGRLLLVRRVSLDGWECVQGCWLDWAAIRASLLAGVADLLPGAELAPVSANADGRKTRLLAALPVELIPKVPSVPELTGLTPVRLSLLIAWGCVVLAAGAIAILLSGALSLSERRGAFVSAVTHELRTPLTTFRMYTDMLTGGMVPDEDKRRRYLETLRLEADRLSHLVENVLAYARLERGRLAGRQEVLQLDELLARTTGRLRDRASAASMELIVEPPPVAAVRADVSAVEQILFNLVDNACKYAAEAQDRRIRLCAQVSGAEIQLRVRDHGPGITPAQAGRLFRPFVKSAHQAANSAPGVGLGLALSRRLARAMGGDLTLESGAPGCLFVLTLPAASTFAACPPSEVPSSSAACPPSEAPSSRPVR